MCTFYDFLTKSFYLFQKIVGTALLLFSVMIQWNVVNLVETPIVLACPQDTTQLCVKELVLK